MTESSDYRDDCISVPLERVLRCSLEKIHEARRCRSGANLRKNLLIANIIFKSRNEILEYRTRVFIERNRQLPGIKGRIVYTHPSLAATAIDERSQVVEVETRSEEVLEVEECLVQEELLVDQEKEVLEELREIVTEEDEDVEVCEDVEKENSPPAAAALATAPLTPLTLELPADTCTWSPVVAMQCSYEAKAPRKRRSDDGGETLSISNPSKRPTPDVNPEPAAPAAAAAAICSLTENFHKAISLQLPPYSLLQMNPLAQQQHLAVSVS